MCVLNQAWTLPARNRAWYEGNRLKLTRRIMLDDQVIGAIYLESDLLEVNRRLARFTGLVLIVLVIAALVAFLLSSRLQRIISQPIGHLAQTARAKSGIRSACGFAEITP